MNIDQMWERFFAMVAQAIFYGCIGYVSIWLLRSKILGHRYLVGATAVFGVLRFIDALFAAADVYYHGKSTTTWMFVANAALALALALMIVKDKWNIRTTLRRTETANVLETEKQLAGETLDNLKEYRIDAALEETRHLLSKQRSVLAGFK